MEHIAPPSKHKRLILRNPRMVTKLSRVKMVAPHLAKEVKRLRKREG